MTAYEIPNLRFALEAAAATARRRFVKVDAAGKGLQAGAGDAVVGASMNDPAINETLEVADGIVMVEAGDVVAAGADVQSDADGKAITLAAVTVVAAVGPATTTIPQTKKAGKALTGATAAGQLIAVKI